MRKCYYRQKIFLLGRSEFYVDTQSPVISQENFPNESAFRQYNMRTYKKRQYQTEWSDIAFFEGQSRTHASTDLRDHPARSPIRSSMFSTKMPYPTVGLLMRTWVMAPTSLPSCKMGEPDRCVVNKGQQNL